MAGYLEFNDEQAPRETMARVKIAADFMTNEAERLIMERLVGVGWEARVVGADERHAIIAASKRGVNRRVALVRDVEHASRLDVDAVVAHGVPEAERDAWEQRKPPVIDADCIQDLIVRWGEDVPEGAAAPLTAERTWLRFESEAPLVQVWAHLRHLGSVKLARRLIEQRMRREVVKLTDSQIDVRAEGIAYCVRNGVDYFRRSEAGGLTQRILNLYYGTMALAAAEMLAGPQGKIESLAKIERITNCGHGLYTLDGEKGDFPGLIVGTYANGFHFHWLRHLGVDTSLIPQAKVKETADLERLDASQWTSLRDLLARVPELRTPYEMVFSEPPLNVGVAYHLFANRPHALWDQGPPPKQTFLDLFDETHRLTTEFVEQLPAPLSQIEYAKSDTPGRHFRALLDHPDSERWQDALKIHTSPFDNGSLILPVFGTEQYRVLVSATLYALSIVVRYRPTVWREVLEGEQDQYRVLVESFLDVVDRVLPEKFLSAITGMKVITAQPGTMR